MEVYTVVLFLTAAVIGCFLQARHLTYVLQRKNFNQEKYLGWYKKKLFQIIPKHILAACTIPLCIFGGEIGFILSGMVYILLSYMYISRPLRYKFYFNFQLVKVIALMVLLCGIMVLSAIIFTNGVFIFCSFAAVYIIVPYFIMFSNLLAHKLRFVYF